MYGRIWKNRPAVSDYLVQTCLFDGYFVAKQHIQCLISILEGPNPFIMCFHYKILPCPALNRFLHLIKHHRCFECFKSRLEWDRQFFLCSFSIRQFELVVHNDINMNQVYAGELGRLNSFQTQKPWVQPFQLSDRLTHQVF